MFMNLSKTWMQQMKANKCKFMHFLIRNENNNCIMLGVSLETKSTKRPRSYNNYYKLPQMYQPYRITEKVKTSNKNVSHKALRYVITNMCTETITILYKTLVRSHEKYAVKSWSHYMRKDKEAIEKIQS